MRWRVSHTVSQNRTQHRNEVAFGEFRTNRVVVKINSTTGVQYSVGR